MLGEGKKSVGPCELGYCSGPKCKTFRGVKIQTTYFNGPKSVGILDLVWIPFFYLMCFFIRLNKSSECII